VNLCFLGELTTAWTYLEQGLALYEASRHRVLILRYVQDPGMVCLVYAAWVLWWRGYPDQALHYIEQALALAQQCMHPFCRAFALTFAVILHQCRRETQAVSTYVEESLSLAQQYGFPLFVAMGGVFRNWALAEHRPEDESVEQIRAGVAAYRATGAEIYRPYFLGLLAEAYANRGRPDAGLEALAEALTRVETTGERLYAAELYRLKGQLLLARSLDNCTEAEACFQQALALARRQQAKLLELRASVSLGRLWLQQGKRDPARRLLEAIYEWFTEGFDTRDLMEAKAL
jgi:predicted ATPase